MRIAIDMSEANLVIFLAIATAVQLVTFILLRLELLRIRNQIIMELRREGVTTRDIILAKENMSGDC